MIATRIHETLDLSWRPNDVREVNGFGFVFDDILGAVNDGVASSDHDYLDLGLAIYRIQGSDLVGLRVQSNDPERRKSREQIGGAAALNGEYEISRYEAPFRPGRVKITPNGDAYLFAWSTPELEFIGTGLRLGNFVVVGYSRDKLPGINAYCVSPPNLQGIGAFGDRKTLSRQILRPDDQSPSNGPDCISALGGDAR